MTAAYGGCPLSCGSLFRGLLVCGIVLCGEPLTVAAGDGAAEPQAAVAPAPAWPAERGPVLVPPRAQAASPCGDVLAESGLRLPGLEFLFCRREGTDEAASLVARYRVRGAQAAQVEAALRGHCGMAALQRTAGIWRLPPDGEGRLPGAIFGPEAAPRPAASPAVARISMGEVPRPGVFAAAREDWGRLDWFSVRVELSCAPQP